MPAVQAVQLTESSPHSSNANVALHQKPTAAGPPTSFASQQLNGGTGHTEHYTQTDIGMDDTASCRLRSRFELGMAAQLRAGHAGLLQFKRHWPVPRPLLLSDSDDSDSLSEFDSIADFHTEPAASGHKSTCQDGSLAVQPADDESQEAALQIRTPGGNSGIAKSSRSVAAGALVQRSMHMSALYME